MELDAAGAEYDVEFYLMPQSTVEQFSNEETFEYSIDASQTDSNYVNSRVSFEAGEYAIVAGNTAAGRAVLSVENTVVGPAENEVDIEA